jgi:hypothetical protein
MVTVYGTSIVENLQTGPERVKIAPPWKARKQCRFWLLNPRGLRAKNQASRVIWAPGDVEHHKSPVPRFREQYSNIKPQSIHALRFHMPGSSKLIVYLIPAPA